MKITFKNLLLGITIVSLFSCTKDENLQDNFNPDFTTPPADEAFGTTLRGFITADDNAGTTSNVTIAINNDNYYCSRGFFDAGSITVNKYNSKLIIGDGGAYYLRTTKTFATSGASVNYVNIKAERKWYSNRVFNSLTTTTNFGTGASVVFSPNTLWQPAQGSYQVETGSYLNGEMYPTYLDPTVNDFGNRLPCYNMGDDEQRRWFLKSYGVTNFQIIYRNGGGDTYLDLYNGGTAKVKIPIPASLLSNAPDIITKWKLKDGLWVYGGAANKVGNFYEADIDAVTSWNFAIKQPGIYKTVRVRTDSGAVVVNTGIRIKSGSRILTEVQTDADGNGFCFIPANESVNIEVVNSWPANTTNSLIASVTVPPSASQYIDVTVPANSDKLITLKGNVTNCSGNTVQSGTIIFKGIANSNYFPSDYIFPFKDGKYNVAFASPSSQAGRLHAKSYNDEGSDTSLNMWVGTQNKYNLRTCVSSTRIYMNYALDGGPQFTMSGNISGPYNPYLIAHPLLSPSPHTSISATASSSNSIEFDIQTIDVNTPNGLGVTVRINGNLYFYEYLKPNYNVFTRYDFLTGGFIIGSVDSYIKDLNNVSHHLVADFALYRQ